MSGSKKFLLGLLSITIFLFSVLGITYCVRNAYGKVDNPTPDDPDPDTELFCVFDTDWFEQISGAEINVSDDVKETITKENINSITFDEASTGTYLCKLNSGIDVYYTRGEDGQYSVDFVSDETIYAPENCDNLFSDCSALTGFYCKNYNTSKVASSTLGSSDLDETIANAQVAQQGITKENIQKIAFLKESDKEYLATLQSGIEVYYTKDESNSMYELDFVGNKIYAAEDCSFLFCGYSGLVSIDFSNFDTGNVKTMESMFLRCSWLTNLDVSNFDTSNVTNMKGMFSSCFSLTSLDLSNFDTSNVTNMQSMFFECSALTSLNVSNFNTSNVTDMQDMFVNCYSLTSLDVSNFDTSNVTNMYSMFDNCSSLTSLDVSNFDTSNVTNMKRMFSNCFSLTSLDLSNFDTSNVTNMQRMFSGCKAINNLNFDNFDTRNVTKYEFMFLGCSSLYDFTVGENYTLDNLYFMIDYYVNDELLSSERIAYNHCPIALLTPSVDGYEFLGWSTNEVDIIDIATYKISMNTKFYAVLSE